jgi:CubicO group peptidase (beta-lactamase class C family)
MIASVRAAAPLAALVSFAALLCGGYSALADEPVPAGEKLAAEVDALFERWNRLDSPGCAVGIIRDGELIFAKGFGTAHLEYGVPITTHTVFELASFSKSFTSACVALLIDQGKISPDDDIRKFLPEMHAFDPPIRVRHLLRCETGLFEHFHILPLAGWDNLPVHSPCTKDDVFTILCGQRRLPFEPGSKFHYGSGDFFLLGMIVERASGKPLPEFARENLFEPLGMTRTFYETDPARIVPQRAVGHYKDRDGTWRQWRSASYYSGGSGVHTCLEDLHRWDQNFENNRLPRGKYVDEFLAHGMVLGNRFTLDADAYVKKANPHIEGSPGQHRGTKRMQFTGGLFGSAVAMARFPEHRFTVICLANTDEIRPWTMAERIADLYLGDRLEPMPAAEERKIVAVPPDELRDKVGAYYLADEGRAWRVSLRDGKLYNSNDIGETYELQPLGDNRFQPEKYPTDTFTFERDPAGASTGGYTLRLSWATGAVSYRPVELSDPKSISYGDYTGEYFSDELSTVYRFKFERDALWLRVNSRRWERLEPTIADEFIAANRIPHDARVLRFLRDDHRRVSGITVNLWRIKDLRFTRRALAR